MLEFYFWFRFWPHYSQQPASLHQQQQLVTVTTTEKRNFIRIVLTTSELRRHMIFQAGRNRVANLLPVSGLVTSYV